VTPAGWRFFSRRSDRHNQLLFCLRPQPQRKLVFDAQLLDDERKVERDLVLEEAEGRGGVVALGLGGGEGDAIDQIQAIISGGSEEQNFGIWVTDFSPVIQLLD
jgi:hypothetical protein